VGVAGNLKRGSGVVIRAKFGSDLFDSYPFRWFLRWILAGGITEDGIYTLSI
jgi:hypothetical protein